MAIDENDLILTFAFWKTGKMYMVCGASNITKIRWGDTMWLLQKRKLVT